MQVLELDVDVDPCDGRLAGAPFDRRPQRPPSRCSGRGSIPSRRGLRRLHLRLSETADLIAVLTRLVTAAGHSAERRPARVATTYGTPPTPAQRPTSCVAISSKDRRLRRRRGVSPPGPLARSRGTPAHRPGLAQHSALAPQSRPRWRAMLAPPRRGTSRYRIPNR